MKSLRRRRHLRPRPSRSQIRHQIRRVRATLQAFQLACLPEAPDGSLGLRDAIVQMLEVC